MRYDRELVQTTVKAMKRVGEIKARRERAFYKNRYYHVVLLASVPSAHIIFRMAASREKQRAHRKKMLEQAKSSVTLHEPLAAEEAKSLNESKKIKLTVNSKHKSALVPGEGRSMGMDID